MENQKEYCNDEERNAVIRKQLGLPATAEITYHIMALS